MFANLTYEGRPRPDVPSPKSMNSNAPHTADTAPRQELNPDRSAEDTVTNRTEFDVQLAFFDLMDEYFASRPHLFSSGASSPSVASATVARPIRSTSISSGRTMPPPAPASSSRNTFSPPPVSPAQTGTPNGEKPDMATRLVMGSFKMGASGASKGLGYLSKNPQAMDALGKMGAAAVVHNAKTGLDQARGKPAPQQQMQEEVASPPPSRTSPTATRAPLRKPPAAAPAADIQAQALYDYDASDSNDLGVQAGQVVYVVSKTSPDWWTCEDANGQKGLIPSAYLKEL